MTVIMQEKIKHIKVNDMEYPLAFNLNVMEKIQDEYETVDKWGELTDGKEREFDAKALKFGITEMINEGIDIENETAETKREFLTSKQVGRIIMELGIEKIANKTQEVVIEATKNDNEPKNV